MTRATLFQSFRRPLSMGWPALLAVMALVVLSGCASAGHAMLGPARPAIAPEQVRVYHVPPRRYETIARVHATSAVGFGTQGQTDATIERLAREAARLGANGVLLMGINTMGSPVGVGVGGSSWGHHGGVSVGAGIPTAQQRAEGIAIHVIEE